MFLTLTVVDCEVGRWILYIKARTQVLVSVQKRNVQHSSFWESHIHICGGW